MRIFNSVVFLLVFVQPVIGQAQDVPAASIGDIRFYVDHAGFRGENEKTYEEFYLMLYADQLRYQRKDEKQSGIFQVTALLKDAQGKAVSRQTWTTEAGVAKEATDLKSLAIYDRWTELLDPGDYVLAVEVADQNAPNKGQVEFALQIPEMRHRYFYASQIEFVAHAEQGVTRKHFAKGNRTIIPNPSRRYGVLNPVLYFYYELYNIPEFAEGAFTVTYSIQEKDGQTVKTLPKTRVRKPGATASLVHGVEVSTNPSGIYELSAQVADSAHGELLRFSRKFELIQMDYFGWQPSVTAAQAELAGRLLKYHASPEEYQFYQRLNSAGKAQFLIRFWHDRDPTPGTVQNEYLEQVQQRYHYANEYFGWANEEGWANDRGRVLIRYGMPEEIDRHHSEAETVPYEIWLYRRERNYQFIFGDLRSNGRFVLLHSSRENEIHNASWMELIRKM